MPSFCLEPTCFDYSPCKKHGLPKTVLVLGASGYIGLAVGVALRRQGHRVFGVTRSDQGVQTLIKNEIRPVQAEQQDTAVWSAVAAQCDVVIDAIGYNGNSKQTFESYEAVKAQRAANGLATRFIFTSGIMTYGVAGDKVATPLDEASEPEPFASNPHGLPRKLFEELVTKSGGEVVRPGWVYGGSGGTYNSLFFGQVDVAASTVTIKGRPDKQYSWVHIEDLATAFQLLVDAPGSMAGQLFNFVAEDYPTYEEIIVAAALVAGIKKEELKIVREELVGEDWQRFLETRVVLTNAKSRNLLGWEVKHKGFVQEMELYYPAWLLYNKK